MKKTIAYLFFTVTILCLNNQIKPVGSASPLLNWRLMISTADLKELIKGLDINAHAANGNTILMDTIDQIPYIDLSRLGRPSVPGEDFLHLVSVMIEEGLDVNATNNDGDTILHKIVSNNTEVLSHLLVEDHNRRRLPSRETIFSKFLNRLASAGMDFNAKNKNDQTALDILLEREDMYGEKSIEKAIEILLKVVAGSEALLEPIYS